MPRARPPKRKNGTSAPREAASSISPSRGNFLSQLDFNGGSDFQLASQRLYCPVSQIFLRRFAGKLFVAVKLKGNPRPGGSAEAQFVMKRDGLKDCAQFVISVRALAQNVQAQIN